MKQVRDLTSLELDGLIAKIEGIEVERRDYGWAIRYPFDPEGPANEFSSCHNWMWVTYSPSTDWEQGGPIIESKKIRLWFYEHVWAGYSLCALDEGYAMLGETPLIAAMRAYVASIYGDEVRDGTT